MDEERFMEMAASASVMHSMFESYVAAGFTEDQACKIIAYFLDAITSRLSTEEKK